MNPAAEAALRHVREVQGWSDVRIPEVRREPAGTALVVIRVRDRGTAVCWTYGVRVSRTGEVLEDAVLINDWPQGPSAEDESRSNITTGRR